MRRRRQFACKVCRHEQRFRIEYLVCSGASQASVGREHGLGKDILSYHMRRHVSAADRARIIAGPIALQELARRAQAENLSILDYLHVVKNTLLSQLAVCRQAGDAFNVGALSGRLVELLRVMGKLTGDIVTTATGSVNITNNVVMNSPHFAGVQAALLRALRPYPEARLAVISALRELDEDNAVSSSATPMKQVEHVAT